MENTDIEAIREVVGKVMHPAINCSLLELGIVKDLVLDDNKVKVTLAFPFAGIPIANQLMESIREPISQLGVESDFEVTQMSPEEVETFLSMEQKNWKG